MSSQLLFFSLFLPVLLFKLSYVLLSPAEMVHRIEESSVLVVSGVRSARVVMWICYIVMHQLCVLSQLIFQNKSYLISKAAKKSLQLFVLHHAFYPVGFIFSEQR